MRSTLQAKGGHQKTPPMTAAEKLLRDEEAAAVLQFIEKKAIANIQAMPAKRFRKITESKKMAPDRWLAAAVCIQQVWHDVLPRHRATAAAALKVAVIV